MNVEEIKLYTPKNLSRKNARKRSNLYHKGYLPKEDSGYFEIARICLSSSTGDLVSIRAKEVENSFHIHVVDEYESDFIDFIQVYESIPNQNQIFDIIKNMKMDGESKTFLNLIVDMNDLSISEDILKFLTIESYFYPNLVILLQDYLESNGF